MIDMADWFTDTCMHALPTGKEHTIGAKAKLGEISSASIIHAYSGRTDRRVGRALLTRGGDMIRYRCDRFASYSEWYQHGQRPAHK